MAHCGIYQSKADCAVHSKRPVNVVQHRLLGCSPCNTIMQLSVFATKTNMRLIVEYSFLNPRTDGLAFDD